MDRVAQVQWLQQNTILGALSTEVLAAIAVQVQEESIPENYQLILENTYPQALYFLHSGRLESYRSRKTDVADVLSLLPGALLHLKELLLDQPAERTVITLSDCSFWKVSREAFLTLAEQYPELNRAVSLQLVEELAQVSSQLAFEQERQVKLRPYLVPKTKRGIVGSSRYATRLREDIQKASADRQPVIIFGEPGLNKDNIAALIQFGSCDRREPLIQIDGDQIKADGAELFGQIGGELGLLGWLGKGTLILNNAQEIAPGLQDKLALLLKTGAYTPVGLSKDEAEKHKPLHSQARIMLTTEKQLPLLDRKNLIGHSIKVTPLRVRKTDIAAQVQYYVSVFCRERGIPRPRVTPEVIRRLQSYDFPNNLSELEDLISRALIQSDGAKELTEAVFWSTSSKTKRFRLNLLNAFPQLRQFLRSSWWPDRINFGLVLPLFPVVIFILFWGPQDRAHNIGLNLFWAWWWPVILFLFPFLGRVWCAVCPFMIYGEVVQKLSLWLFPRKLKAWPRDASEKWGGWFLFGMFSLILLWEELWNLEDTAYLSSWLLLLITGGAIICSLLFERRYWCRYLCPIGGMNGLFAKLSITELRAQQGICSATCTTYQCYKGGPQKGEGLATGGCPVYSHPAQLQDNRNCVLCMTCLKACPHRSVEFNLRPPGIELWTTHTPSYYEVSLLFLLFGAVLLHRLPELEGQFGWNLHLENFGIHAGVSVLALLAPGAIALVAHVLLRLFNQRIKPRPFLEMAYGYLPLVLGGSLAHYLRLGLTEGGRVLPVTLATFGYSGGGTLNSWITVADPIVIAFLQGVTLISSVWLSILLTHKIAKQPILSVLPQHLATFSVGILFWKVTVGW